MRAAFINIMNFSVSSADVRPAGDAVGTFAGRIGAKCGITARSAKNLQSTETRR